jgi:hypothetical protein
MCAQLSSDFGDNLTAKYDDTGHRSERVEPHLSAAGSPSRRATQTAMKSKKAIFDETSRLTTNKNGIALWTANHFKVLLQPIESTLIGMETLSP